MGWPDFSRWIWSYVISRLKLFTDLDPSKLELSGRSLSVANVEIDKDRINIPGILITQFVVEKLTVELTSSGIAIGVSGVSIDALVKSLEPPDLAFSRILEQTRTDMEGYGGGDMSGVKSRFADFALSQLKLRITDVRAALRYPNSDVVICVHVYQILMNQKHVIEFESVTLTRENCDCNSDSDSDSLSESSSTDTNSEGEFGDADDEDEHRDDAHDKMAQSVFLGKRGLLAANLPLAKSVYFDALEGVKHPSQRRDNEELGTIDRMVLVFSMDPLEVSLSVDRVSIDGLLALEIVVDTLNLVWKSLPSQDNTKSSLKSELTIASLEVYETLSESSGMPVSLTNICLKKGNLEIEGLSIADVVNVSPLLTAWAEDGKILVDMTLPVSVSLDVQSMPHIHRLSTRIADILSELTTPPDPRPTPIHINLPEFRLAIGQHFTLLVFPESLSNTGFNLREILLTASEGQLLIRDLKCQSIDDLGGIKSNVDELHVRLSAGFVEELHSIVALLTGAATPEEDSSNYPRLWEAIDLPNTYFKVAHLLVEDSEQVFMRGDMEFRTVHYNADLRAGLDLDHHNVKTSFELSAFSTDGLKSIESNLSFYDFDVYAEKYAAGESTDRDVHPVKEEPEPCIAPRRMPEIRSKLDFGNGIRLHFPDAHNSVFAISLDVPEVFVAGDGAISLIIPELYVKLEDNGGDVPLLKMQDTNISHFQAAVSGSESSVTIKRAALATCPDTYSLLKQLPALILPPPLEPQFDVDPNISIDVFKDVAQSRFTPDELSKSTEDDLAVTLDTIDIKENYIEKKPGTTRPAASVLERSSDSISEPLDAKRTNKFKLSVKVVQWQMFDGFDLERTREAVGNAINRIEKAAAETNDSDRDTEDEDSERILVGDFMYNSLFVVAQGGGSNKQVLSTQVADELGGTGSSGLSRSAEPKLTLVLRKIKAEYNIYLDSHSQLSLSIRDGKVTDTVPTSAFSHLLSPLGVAKQKFFAYKQDTMGPPSSPEFRVTFAMQPLHLQLDQDTVEFVNRFFQFDVSDESTASFLSEQANVPSNVFLQRFEFGELPLVVDYTPKKIDYRSLRSGVAAELVNLFVVKGAKLTLRPCVLHGINGWDRLLQDLSGFWGPDIRANQLAGLLSGIWPVRRALKLGEGIKSWAIVPMRSKRTGQVTRGAGLLVRRTMDELLRLRTVWLDSADKALGGDTEFSPEEPAPELSSAIPETSIDTHTAPEQHSSPGRDSELGGVEGPALSATLNLFE